MSRAALVAAALALLSCRVRPPFSCADASQCGPGGACVDQACAFADSACSSGLRFDPSAAGRARQCVVVDAGMPPAPADLAEPLPGAADLAVADLAPPVVVHFYPDIQAQIDGYHCPGCHSGLSPSPTLVANDTLTADKNYQTLQPLAGPDLITSLVAANHPGTHPAGADLTAWQRWVANPVP